VILTVRDGNGGMDRIQQTLQVRGLGPR
jgi:hypothetical protein